MMMLHGTYTTNRMNEEYAFSISAQHEDARGEIPYTIRELLLDMGGEEDEDKQTIHLPRIRMAEGLSELSVQRMEVSAELAFWIRVSEWVITLAAKGYFFPCLVREEDRYYSLWKLMGHEPKEKEELDGWIEQGKPHVSEQEADEWITSFVHDIMDGWVRQVINTKFSLKTSQLGKLLKFKPFYLHEEWMHRLCMEEHVGGEGPRWEELYQAYREWTSKNEDQRKESGGLAFRLEPSDHPNEWNLRYFWSNRGAQLRAYSELEHFEDRHLYIKQLAHASRVFEGLETLAEETLIGCRLSIQEAYRFFKTFAPELREQGYPVYVPASLIKNKRNKLRMNIQYQDQWDSGGMGLDSLLHFDFSLAIGDHMLTPEEWEQMSSGVYPLYQVEGEWIELNPDELKRSASWIQKELKKKTLTLRDVLFLHAAMDDEEFAPVEIESSHFEGWLEEWFTLVGKGHDSFPLPREFEGELRPYQKIGMSWLIHLRKWGMGACLADDMGLGKTVQFLAYLAYCKEQEWVKKPYLLICPTSVLGNWQKEIERFVPGLAVYTHHGADRLSGEDFRKKAERYDLVITTYSLVQRDTQDLIAMEWDGVALDEAQHIKNMGSIQSKVIRQLSGEHRIALTGTPIENRINELWAILDFLNKGFLGAQTIFRRQFVLPIEKEGNKKRLDTLKRLVNPFILRRSKSDPAVIQDLPEKMEKKEYCYLSPEQAVLYERVVEELLKKETGKSGLERKGLILASISKLKQICNHPALFMRRGTLGGMRSGKLTRLQELLEEMFAEGDRVLLFTQFAQMGHLLKRELEEKWKSPVPFLYGGLSKDQRDAMIEEFQQPSGPPLFLLSLKAGGIGLNLTRANRVIHFDRWWNPAVENQATDRAFRIGQTKTVHVHKFVCLGTIEEKIDLMIERKKELVSDIMGQSEAWITELSTHELRELLALRNELLED
ncbi:DEAD/DEAH box helicase [Ammoniphilus sp. CFH 90114]|uniref:DEAD/DEAH box helicase n=1 Tax=Ammoniphilus sp. CFH 90114 TaxID=2493665 RepID=UPI00100EB5D4|nr:DEAD/DEAH box helicase [Ammoniphilus sp. CFH 90114]RXT07812.1 DEAD/DEAH box helicase [Ammoniphilus sp. CFH 90114]